MRIVHDIVLRKLDFVLDCVEPEIGQACLSLQEIGALLVLALAVQNKATLLSKNPWEDFLE